MISVLAEHGGSVLTPQWCLTVMELILRCFICCPVPSILSIQLMSEVSEKHMLLCKDVCFGGSLDCFQIVVLPVYWLWFG